MVKWMLPLILIFSAPRSFAAGTPVCDLEVSPRVQSAINLVTDALKLDALTIEDLIALKDSPQSYNPFEHKSRLIGNHSFRHGYDKRAARFKEGDYKIFRKALGRFLERKKEDELKVSEAGKKAANFLPLRFVDENSFAGWLSGFSEARAFVIDGRPVFAGSLREPVVDLDRSYIFDPFGPTPVQIVDVSRSAGNHRFSDYFRYEGRRVFGIYNNDMVRDFDRNSDLNLLRLPLTSEGKVVDTAAFATPKGEALLIGTNESLIRKNLYEPTKVPEVLYRGMCREFQKHAISGSTFITCITTDLKILVYDVAKEKLLTPIGAGASENIAGIMPQILYRENGRTYLAFNQFSRMGIGSTVPPIWGVVVFDLESGVGRHLTPLGRTSWPSMFVFLNGEPHFYYESLGHLYFQSLISGREWKIENGGRPSVKVQVFAVNGRQYLTWGNSDGEILVYSMDAHEMMTKLQLSGIIFQFAIGEFQGDIYAIVGVPNQPPRLLQITAQSGRKK